MEGCSCTHRTRSNKGPVSWDTVLIPELHFYPWIYTNKQTTVEKICRKRPWSTQMQLIGGTIYNCCTTSRSQKQRNPLKSLTLSVPPCCTCNSAEVFDWVPCLEIGINRSTPECVGFLLIFDILILNLMRPCRNPKNLPRTPSPLKPLWVVPLTFSSYFIRRLWNKTVLDFLKIRKLYLSLTMKYEFR